MYKIELFENEYKVLTRYSNKETSSEAIIDVINNNMSYTFDSIKVVVTDDY